ncbi:MAG: branched-chain amino acid ABC transporter permease [Burkholderiales bacterium]|nr:branched-chain amino acid ABC transporter permease [Burkholderiales bacterium]
MTTVPLASRHYGLLGSPGKAVWIGFAVVLVAALFVPAYLNPYYLRVLIIGLLYGYVSACWNIIGGYAGQMSLGHSMFFGIGSYAVAVFARHGWDPLVLALPAGIVVSAVLAWFVASTCFRYALKGIYFAVGTLLLAEIVQIAVVNSEFFGRSQGLQFPPRLGVLNVQFETDLPYFYIFLALAVLMILGSLWLERTKLGYDLIALREQEEGAQALGVDTNRIKRIAFVLSAVLTAVGGFLYASLIKFVEPGYDLSVSITLIMIMGAVVGGRGTAVGPFLGGLVVVLVQEALATAGSWIGTTSFSALAQMTYGLFFVVTLLLFPRGVVGEWIRRRADKRARLLGAVE